MTAQEMFDAAFAKPRTSRSVQYRIGVKSVLSYRAREIEWHPCPFVEGTAEADAYFAGQVEGHQICEEHGVPIRTRERDAEAARLPQH